MATGSPAARAAAGSRCTCSAGDDVRLGLQVLDTSPFVQRVGVEPGAVCGLNAACSQFWRRAWRASVGGFCSRMLFAISVSTGRGFRIDLARPVPCRSFRGKSASVVRFEPRRESVAVELHRHFARPALHVEVGENQLPAGVVVSGVVRRELVCHTPSPVLGTPSPAPRRLYRLSPGRPAKPRAPDCRAPVHGDSSSGRTNR